MDTLQNALNRIVDGFVSDVTDITRCAALASLESESVLGQRRATTRRRDRAGRPRGSRGAKRTPEDLAAISAHFAAFVREHPGLRIEQINKRLGTTTGELALPIRKLIEDNRIQTQGQKRATTYFASKGASA